jgi:hypothetical protein
MGKYEPLRDYLARLRRRPGADDIWPGGTADGPAAGLSAGAPRVVGNDSYRSQSIAWQAAGWHVTSVDQTFGQVVFAREIKGETPATRQRAQAMAGSYIDAQVIAAIKAQQGADQFDRSKLLRLIGELNDNYARGNGYAVHALLQAILDHIPPLLGCASFTAAVNNYRWSRTDQGYVRKLLDFKLQADDVLHRQISDKADLLSLDDAPPRAYPPQRHTSPIPRS